MGIRGKDVEIKMYIVGVNMSKYMSKYTLG